MTAPEPVAAAEPPAGAVVPPTTGEPRVDAAVTRLVDLETSPVSDHVGIFDEAHRLLQDALADLDEG